MAGTDDRRGLALDEMTEGISVAPEDGIDDRALIALTARACGGWSVEDGLTPWAGPDVRAGRRRSARPQCEGGRAEPSVIGPSGHPERSVVRRGSVVVAAAMAAVVTRVVVAIMAAVVAVVVGRVR